MNKFETLIFKMIGGLMMISLIINTIDTSILVQFNGIITAVVGIGMIVVTGKNLLKGNVQSAIMAIVVAGLSLWAVNDLNGFVNVITILVKFIRGIIDVKK